MKLSCYLKSTGQRRSAFARELGVYPSAITRWISGEREPSAKNIKRISEITGGRVTANDFFGFGGADHREDAR